MTLLQRSPVSLLRMALPALLGFVTMLTVTSDDEDAAGVTQELPSAPAGRGGRGRGRAEHELTADITGGGSSSSSSDAGGGEAARVRDMATEARRYMEKLQGQMDRQLFDDVDAEAAAAAAAVFKPPGTVRFHPDTLREDYTAFSTPVWFFEDAIQTATFDKLAAAVHAFVEGSIADENGRTGWHAANHLGGTSYWIPQKHDLNDDLLQRISHRAQDLVYEATLANADFKCGSQYPFVIDVLEAGEEQAWHVVERLYHGREFEMTYVLTGGAVVEWEDRDGVVRTTKETANSMMLTTALGARRRVRRVATRRVAIRMVLSQGVKETKLMAIKRLTSGPLKKWLGLTNPHSRNLPKLPDRLVDYFENADELRVARRSNAYITLSGDELAYHEHYTHFDTVTSVASALSALGWIEKDGVVKFLARGGGGRVEPLKGYEDYNVYSLRRYLAHTWTPPAMPTWDASRRDAGEAQLKRAQTIVRSTPQHFAYLCGHPKVTEVYDCVVARLPRNDSTAYDFLLTLTEPGTWVLNHYGAPVHVVDNLRRHLGIADDATHFVVKLTRVEHPAQQGIDGDGGRADAAANARPSAATYSTWYSYVAVPEHAGREGGDGYAPVSWPRPKHSTAVEYPDPW